MPGPWWIDAFEAAGSPVHAHRVRSRRANRARAASYAHTHRRRHYHHSPRGPTPSSQHEDELPHVKPRSQSEALQQHQTEAQAAAAQAIVTAEHATWQRQQQQRNVTATAASSAAARGTAGDDKPVMQPSSATKHISLLKHQRRKRQRSSKRSRKKRKRENNGKCSNWVGPTLDTLLFVLVAFYALIAAPFTKVEESFHVQAAHDLIMLTLESETNATPFCDDLKHQKEHNANRVGAAAAAFAYHHESVDDAAQWQQARPRFAWKDFDHHTYPGVVPRSSVGALVLASTVVPLAAVTHTLIWPFVWQQAELEQRCDDHLWLLATLRLALAAFSVAAFSFFRRGLTQYCHGDNLVGIITVIITMCQFHLPFYMSRTLGNVFALALSNIALGGWLRGDDKLTVSAFAVACVIFRCDMILLAVPSLIAHLLYAHCDRHHENSDSSAQSVRLRVRTLLWAGSVAAVLSIGLTVAVDSLFWGRLIWPEWEVFRFNALQNRSSEWGTSAVHWYFTSALPRSLFVALPLSIVGFFISKQCRRLMLPAILFVALYSLLPHKEVRFLFPCLPILNACAAVGFLALWRAWRNPLSRLLLIAALLGSLCAALQFVHISSFNYPGGVALRELHHHLLVEGENHTGGTETGTAGHILPVIHVDNVAAMTGVTRFGERRAHFRYSKEEGIDHDSIYSERHDYMYLLAPANLPEDPHGFAPLPVMAEYGGHSDGAGAQSHMVRGVAGVRVDLDKILAWLQAPLTAPLPWPPLTIVRDDSVAVYERHMT